MTIKKILDEIQAIDTSVLTDGLSFADHYVADHNITPIEQLLFFCKCKKYYYNYTEKRLRVMYCHIENMMSMIENENGDTELFTCNDLEDEDSIIISAQAFADKIVCYEDFHKVVTYDPTTHHYECYFVDLGKKKVDGFFKDAKDALPSELKQYIHTPVSEKPEILAGESPEVVAAFRTICDFLQSNDGELSEIRFTNISEGVKIDLITSKLYSSDDSSVVS